MSRREKLMIVPVLIAGLLAAPAIALAVSEVPAERGSGFFDRAAAEQARTVLHGWLMSRHAPTALEHPIEVRIDPATLDALARPDAGERKILVGAVAGVDTLVTLGSRGRFGPSAGALRQLDDGSLSWSAALRSPGAVALRARFAGLDLPAGVELYVYNRHGDAFGPYTGKGPLGAGEFWTHTVTGDEMLVQMRLPDRAAAKAVSFAIAELGHLGPRFLKGVLDGARADAASGVPTRAFCSFNASCVENASCSSIPGGVQIAQDAVAHILFQSGPSFFICSGGLLADTDAGTDRPLFLTANHCISQSGEAASMEAFFQFDTPCSGACYDPDGVVPSTLGATILASNSSQDFTLMELSQPAPAGSAFMGWTATAVAFSNGTNLFRISHPKGAPQAYSTQDVDSGAPTCGSLPRGNYIYSRDTFGGTEGGSSGSPVVNGSGQVVGQLFGACGFNVNDPCDSASNATVDGAFAAYFSQVQSILDPTPCTDNDGDGFCTPDDCNDNDPSVNPGAAEICGNGVDDDCDGAIDEGCGTCLPKGDPCTSNIECCSNKCKGKPGAKKCK